MRAGFSSRLGILDSPGREHAPKKALAKSVERMLDARILHQIHPDADYTSSAIIPHEREHFRARVSNPTNTERATMDDRCSGPPSAESYG